jgi:two-component system, OmpR family, sensor kinase
MSALSESGDHLSRAGRSPHPLPSAAAFSTMDGDLDLETITDAIDAGRPLTEILDLVVDRAELLLDAAETFILLRDGDLLVGAAQRGLTGPAHEIRIPLGESIEGQVAVRRRPLIMTDPLHNPRFRNLPQRSTAIAAIIALPLQARGKVLGVLSAATVAPTDFDETLVLLLVLADLASLAIETSRSTAREARQTRLVDLLRYVSNVDFESDLKATLGPVATRIAEVMGSEKVDIMFLDPERSAFVSLGVSQTPLGHKQKELGLDIVPAQAATLLAQVYRTGESVLVPDSLRDDRVYRPFIEQLGVRTLMYSPVEVGGERRAILASTSTQPDAFGESDLAVHDLIARRLSLALQHLELTEDLSRLEAERLARLERDNHLDLLAHDVRNPLAAIKGYAQLAHRRLRMGDVAYVERALGLINERADQLNRMMNDMLDVTRMAAGTFTIQRQTLDLVALLRDEIEAARVTTSRHAIRLDAPAELPVWGDPLRLAEVVQNLLSNAIRYSPQGGPIQIAAGIVEGAVQMSVCDAGMGIAPEDLPRVFDRAYRGRGEQIGGGHGLGLYISREIVRLHGGRIWAESASGQGACFYVVLPVGDAPGSLGL